MAGKEAKPQRGMDRHQLSAALKAVDKTSSEYRAGKEVQSQIRRGQIARWLGGIGLSAAAVDAVFIGWGSMHVIGLPAAVTVDLLIAAGAAGVGAYGLIRKGISKRRREHAASLKDLEVKKKVTGTRGNNSDFRYGVEEGKWYRTPVKTDDGFTTVQSDSIDGVLERFTPVGLVSSDSVKKGVRFTGRPFGKHRLVPDTYKTEPGHTRTDETFKFLRDQSKELGLDAHHEAITFVSGWGWAAWLNKGIHKRAIAGWVKPETEKVGNETRGYVLRIDGRRATIYQTGPNFANDPTDLIKYTKGRKKGKDKPHASIKIRTRSKDPEKIRRLAMRAIVKGSDIRLGREDTPVFNRYVGWLRHYPGLLGAYDGREKKLAPTPGVQATLDRRRAAADELVAAESAAAFAKAEAAEKARIKWPKDLGEQQGWVTYAESVFGAVEKLDHKTAYTYGETGAVVAHEPEIRRVGRDTITYRTIDIISEGDPTKITRIETSQRLDENNTVTEFSIQASGFDTQTSMDTPQYEMSVIFNEAARKRLTTPDNRTRGEEGVPTAITEWTGIGHILANAHPKPQEEPAQLAA